MGKKMCQNKKRFTVPHEEKFVSYFYKNLKIQKSLIIMT